jgi:hypothetical protein
MGPRNAHKDMLDNVVSPITCVSMNHQNQLEQMANVAMFAKKIYEFTNVPFIGLRKYRTCPTFSVIGTFPLR